MMPIQSMVRRMARKAVWAAAVVGVAALAAAPAQAVEITDVLDAMDDDNNDPFDAAVRVRYTSDTRQSAIARQARCLKNDVLGSACPNGSGYVLARELEYERIRNVLNFDLRFGIYKDLEIYAVLPLVISDDWKHEFSPGVSRANSTILPPKDNTTSTPSDRSALFKVPYQSTSRAGMGDVKLGLRWSPFNYYRDASEPTWVFGFEYTAPTGTPMKADNDGVGYGLHEFKLFSNISRRALRIFEPFWGFHAAPRVGASDGLFTKRGKTQRYIEPGFNAGTQFGLTVVPWENPKQEERFEIEAGVNFEYFYRGREYTEIWEALASPNNPCKPSEGCNNVLYSQSALDPLSGKPIRSDGITEVEPYARFGGWGALHYQPVQYFQISAKFNYFRETPHFITYGDIGVDLDGRDKVSAFNSTGENEFSPVYLPAVDTVGQRLRVLDVTNLGLQFAITGKF